MQLGSWIRANKVLVGGIVGLLLIFLLVLIAFTTQKAKQASQSNSTKTSAITTAQTTLSLHADKLVENAQSNELSIVSINMDTHGNLIMGDQFVLQFDPKIILTPVLTPIIPSNFFPQPQIVAKYINTVSGKISFAEIVPNGHPPVRGKGTLATLAFRIAPNTTARSTNITFVDSAQVSGLVKGYQYLQSVQNVVIPLK